MPSGVILKVKNGAVETEVVTQTLAELGLLPGRFVGWTNTGGGDHGGEDWIIAFDTKIAGIHTNIRTFKVNTGIIVTVKAYDGSSHGTFEVHAVDVDVDGIITTKNSPGSGHGGGGGGGGGGGSHYMYGQHGSGGNGGAGIAGSEDGKNGGSGLHERGGHGGAGGNGGGGAGAGIKGAGGTGAYGDVETSTHVPATAGGAGSNGGYGTTPNDNNDTSVDESLLRGKGGGGGGGGGAGDGEVRSDLGYATSSGAGGGAGGAGGRGSGWIKLYATTSIDISGSVAPKGNGGGNGGNGGNAQSGYHPANLNGGNGGAGGDAGASGTRSGGTKGTARWVEQNGADGGNGGHGAGGGLLLKCVVADAIIVSGIIDSRGGGDLTVNGGTVKVFYAGVDPTGAGTWHYGRLYKEVI